MKPEVAIAIYHAHNGKEKELEVLARKHLPTLQTLGLVTERPGMLLKSKGGAIVEIFEWKSAEALEVAHEHPEVAKIWEAMAEVCNFKTLADLPEATKAFSHFSSL